MAKLKIVSFNDGARRFILESFGKVVDKENYVVEKSDPSQRVLTPDGDGIRLEQFAGIKKGSEVFIKSDIVSLVRLAGELVK
ncbi:MAG TPA: hypothetical protein VI791_03625 [Patescibacteria group bacterium]|nr:hypothetical protein [Patescibacteria group bacterium]